MQTMKNSILIRGNPLRHGGRTRRATSPYYGEAALRASPIERAYKTRAVRYSQAVLFPSRLILSRRIDRHKANRHENHEKSF